MSATKIKEGREKQTGKKARTEPPWNVILHNDWENSMPRVILILTKAIPGMSLKKATAIMYEAHLTAGRWSSGATRSWPNSTRNACRGKD